MTGTPGALTGAHWGAYRVIVGDDGKPLRLEGMPGDPAPSPIGLGMLECRTSPLRITRPAVRRGFWEGKQGGRQDQRGQDGFVEVSWDTALNLVAAELDRVRDAHGHDAIYAGSYGWASAGRFHHAQSQLKRFFRLFGGATFSRDSYSYAAAEVVLPHIVAPMGDLLRAHTSWKAIADGASLVVAFGGISPGNAQVEAGGALTHDQADNMRGARKAGVSFVRISPDAADIAPELEAEGLSLRPGADLALMLALAHTLNDEDLHDTGFLTTHCTGFELFVPYLTGASDGQPKDAAWAETLTGVAASDIRALARRMAAQPTLVNASWSLTRQENGEHVVWMLVILAAMLGGIGRPGCGFGVGLGAAGGVGRHRTRLQWPSLPSPSVVGEESYIPVARIADMLLNPGGSYHYDGQVRRYPDIRMIYWAGGNPFHHHQDLNRLRGAWNRAETVIVHEQVWTATARHADIVLPVSMGLERDDIIAAGRDDAIIWSAAAASPWGEARSDHEIFAALARRLRKAGQVAPNFEADFTDRRDIAAWLAAFYEEARARARLDGHDLPDFDTFKRDGMIRLSPPERPVTLLDAFRADPLAHPLATPSGRIEIFSETIAGFGLDGQPGHPVWKAPQEWLGAASVHKFPLHLVSHQPVDKLHSQLDFGPLSRSGKVAGRQVCRLHPQDALSRGITEGSTVRLFNARGACFAVARLDERLLRGVVKIPTGAWLDPDWTNDPQTCRHGNPNVLTPDRPTSLLAQGPAALGCLVDVTLAPEAPEPAPFEPPPLFQEEDVRGDDLRGGMTS